MTTVYFDEKNLILTAKGHAEYSKDGEPDIVCASVSMLAYTLAENILNLPPFLFKKPPKIKLQSGDVEINCFAKDEYYKEILKMFEFTLKGFSLLQYRYSKNVRIKECWYEIIGDYGTCKKIFTRN